MKVTSEINIPNVLYDMSMSYLYDIVIPLWHVYVIESTLRVKQGRKRSAASIIVREYDIRIYPFIFQVIVA